MKKMFSVALAVLMLALTLVPAFAAGGTVTFVGPSEAYRNETDSAGNQLGDAYWYVMANEVGEMSFHADNNGKYVLYNNQYYVTQEQLYDYIWNQLKNTQRYSPDLYPCDEPISIADEYLVFFVQTGPKYNASTVSVLVNGERVEPSAEGAYRVKAQGDMTVRVVETSATGAAGLQRNFYTVKMISGEGYGVQPQIGEPYHYTFYDDNFNFRVRIKRGYSDAGMKVLVMRGVDLQHDEMSDFDFLAGILGDAEELKPTGVDADGCRTYTLKNVTSDCKILVNGVKEEKKNDILSILKRILRMILNFFHIEIAELDNFVNQYNVTVTNNAGAGVDYEIVTGKADEADKANFSVDGGSGVILQVTKRSDVPVNVTWTGMNADGYNAHWTAKTEAATGQTIYTATYTIDNIQSDTTVTIS